VEVMCGMYKTNTPFMPQQPEVTPCS